MMHWFYTYVACPIPGGVGFGYAPLVGMAWLFSSLIKRRTNSR